MIRQNESHQMWLALSVCAFERCAAMEVSHRIFKLRARLLAARGRASLFPEGHRTVVLIDYSLKILQIVHFTLVNEGGIFRQDHEFLNGMERWVSEYFHDVDNN